MTRNRELDLEDLYGCDHEPEIGISEGTEIVAWACRCGKVKNAVEPKPDEKQKPDG